MSSLQRCKPDRYSLQDAYQAVHDNKATPEQVQLVKADLTACAMQGWSDILDAWTHILRDRGYV